jgi:Flp pilus assembly protein TadG
MLALYKNFYKPRDFRKDERGAVAVIVALLLPVLIGMVGVAVEVGYWFSEKRELQTAADAGAIGGAFELLNGNSASISSSASSEATRNGYDSGNGTITVNTPPTSGSYSGDATAVEVIVTKQISLLLSAVMLGDNITVTARSVARAQTAGDSCVIALDTTASSAFSVSGTAQVSLSGCGVTANSNSSTAVTISGTGDLTTDFLNVVGNYSVTGSGNLASASTPIAKSAAVADPYADLTIPALGGCDQTGYKSKANQTATLSPGTYCGGFTVSAQSTVNLNPGTYYINGDSFKVNGGGTLTGSNVTIVLTGSGSDYATMDINGGATVSLSAPTTGDYAGVVIMQDRNAPSNGSNKFNGGSSTEFTGALYFPNQEIEFTGGNDTGGGCIRIVARLVDFNGNSDLDNECDGLGIAGQSIARPALVE